MREAFRNAVASKQTILSELFLEVSFMASSIATFMRQSGAHAVSQTNSPIYQAAFAVRRLEF